MKTLAFFLADRFSRESSESLNRLRLGPGPHDSDYEPSQHSSSPFCGPLRSRWAQGCSLPRVEFRCSVAREVRGVQAGEHAASSGCEMQEIRESSQKPGFGAALRTLSVVAFFGCSRFRTTACPEGAAATEDLQCRGGVSRPSASEPHKTKGCIPHVLSGLGPIVGSLPVAVAVSLEVCERTMREAAASSDESHPASRSIGGKPRSLKALSRDMWLPHDMGLLWPKTSVHRAQDQSVSQRSKQGSFGTE